MWDDDFYRFFRNSRNRTNPFRYNDSYTFNLDKFFNHLPFEAEEEKTPPKFKAVKYVTIIVSEGDDDGIDRAIKILESMRSTVTDPVEAAKSDTQDEDKKFDEDFKEENLWVWLRWLSIAILLGEIFFAPFMDYSVCNLWFSYGFIFTTLLFGGIIISALAGL